VSKPRSSPAFANPAGVMPRSEEKSTRPLRMGGA
jgi:hypothetical protein